MKLVGLEIREGKLKLPKTIGFFPLPFFKFTDLPEIILTKKEAEEHGIKISKINGKKKPVAYQIVDGESVPIFVED